MRDRQGCPDSPRLAHLRLAARPPLRTHLDSALIAISPIHPPHQAHSRESTAFRIRWRAGHQIQHLERIRNPSYQTGAASIP